MSNDSTSSSVRAKLISAPTIWIFGCEPMIIVFLCTYEENITSCISSIYVVSRNRDCETVCSGIRHRVIPKFVHYFLVYKNWSKLKLLLAIEFICIASKKRTLLDFRSKQTKRTIVHKEPDSNDEWPDWCKNKSDCFLIEYANAEQGKGFAIFDEFHR